MEDPFWILRHQTDFSIDFHPQTKGKTESLNQVIENMLHMYLMYEPSKWDDYLHLVEFLFNNGHHTSSGMSWFDALYQKNMQYPNEQNCSWTKDA